MGSWPLIYKNNYACPQVLLNSLKLRTFAAALKILLCCETFLKDFFAKLNTSAPTQLGKKNPRELYCLFNFTMWWLVEPIWVFLRGCCLLEGGILAELFLRVFSFSSTAAAVILENEKTPETRLHPSTRRIKEDRSEFGIWLGKPTWMKERLILYNFPRPIKLNQNLG